MNDNEFLKRLGEVELERACLKEEMERLRSRISVLDKEYTDLKNLLTNPGFDKRWDSSGTLLPESIYYILSGAKEPLHYKDIHRILMNGHFQISGNVSFSNIVVRLNRDERFVKVRPGVYGLAEWNLGRVSPSVAEDNSIVNVGNRGQSIAEEKDMERIKFVLESIEVDIKVTQNSLQALRNSLLHRVSDFKLPENIDPVVAIPALKRKLFVLLEQKDKLGQRLSLLEPKLKDAQIVDEIARLKALS